MSVLFNAIELSVLLIIAVLLLFLDRNKSFIDLLKIRR